MTVETSSRKQTFSGGQSALTFSFRTLVSHPEYIQVSLLNVATSETTALTYSTDYTVAVNSDGVGGTVTVSPSYSTDYNYVVYRQTAALQESAYSNFNQFPASTVEDNLDQLTMLAQEQGEDTGRTLQYPISAPTNSSTLLPVPLADAFLQWDSTGLALQNSVIPDPSTLIKATNAEAAAGTEDTHFMTPAKTLVAIQNLGVTSVSSSTTDIAVVTSGTTYVLTANAATAGSNVILKLNSSGKLPALDGSNLTAIPFIYVKVSDVKTSGTAGGMATSTTWTDRVLNTKDNDTNSIASLASNHVTLPAGTYRVQASAPFRSTTSVQLRVYSVTDASVLVWGQSGLNLTSSAAVGAFGLVSGYFTISVTTAIAIQYYVGGAIGTTDLGFPSNAGQEVYTVAEFIKVG